MDGEGKIKIVFFYIFYDYSLNIVFIIFPAVLYNEEMKLISGKVCAYLEMMRW